MQFVRVRPRESTVRMSSLQSGIWAWTGQPDPI